MCKEKQWIVLTGLPQVLWIAGPEPISKDFQEIQDHHLGQTKDEKVVERLGMLDHGAAVALVERKEAIAQLRARLVNAQAQSAAEATEAGLRGDPELLVPGGQHGRLSVS